MNKIHILNQLLLHGVAEDRNYITRDEIEVIKEELREELTISISKDVARNMCSGFVAALMKDIKTD